MGLCPIADLSAWLNSHAWFRCEMGLCTHVHLSTHPPGFSSFAWFIRDTGLCLLVYLFTHLFLFQLVYVSNGFVSFCPLFPSSTRPLVFSSLAWFTYETNLCPLIHLATCPLRFSFLAWFICEMGLCPLIHSSTWLFLTCLVYVWNGFVYSVLSPHILSLVWITSCVICVNVNHFTTRIKKKRRTFVFV